MIKSAIILAASITFSLAVSAQDKSVAPASQATDVVKDERVKPTNDSESVKRSPVSSNDASELRSNAPASRIERTPEMIEKKKTAPLMSDPQ